MAATDVCAALPGRVGASVHCRTKQVYHSAAAMATQTKQAASISSGMVN
jgi:hypothetical protein